MSYQPIKGNSSSNGTVVITSPITSNGYHESSEFEGRHEHSTMNSGRFPSATTEQPANKMSADKTLDQVKFEQVEETARYILSNTKHRPEIAIVCGTGLGGIGELIKDGFSISYETIPNFVSPRVKGHAGRLLFGTLSGKSVVCMLGRIHSYEGHTMWQVTFPIRVFQRIGVRVLLVTNASGSINPDFEPGDIMIIKDHINLPGLAGLNPLLGLNDERFGTRFPAMSDAYDCSLRALMRRTVSELQLSGIREGVYVCQTGPCYETVAECRMMRILGGDSAGMSTAPEVIVARHGQRPMRVAGLSLITNRCVARYPDDPMPQWAHGGESNGLGPDYAEAHPDHDTIVRTAEGRAADLRLLVASFIGHIDTTTTPPGEH